ncbi:MAG TPA: hypothetical protein VMZ30_10375, partial [Pyrinomonadaceae bacterium]|nr:hypothetical protein [Pyrinomonadaceae bacterium]
VRLDEDTGIVVKEGSFQVFGSGAVYVADGSAISYTNVGEEGYDRTLCLFDVRLHVLANGSSFHMLSRTPVRGTA